MEDYAFVLDYLPQGRPDDPRGRKDPVAYGLGERRFVLLELVPIPGQTFTVGERVYLGRDPGVPRKIDHVRGRVRHEQMTHNAQSELRFVIMELVRQNETRFVAFFNEAGPITTRMHMLELLPGLGKKLMWAIVEERKRGPFKSLKDMDDRVKALHQPEKLIATRIETEIVDPNQKYHLFVLPPAPEEPHGHHGRR